MLKETSLQDWESVVQKQLKTENIYAILTKENLEDIQVRPYYDGASLVLKNLPKVEESTQLVSPYHESAEDNIFAFLLNENVEGLVEKVLFISNKNLAEHISPDEGNRYLSLIDVFSDSETGQLDEQLTKELLAKGFERAICVDIALHQNAGASIMQQLAVGMAKTKDLVEVFGPEILNKIIFKVAVGSNYFFEIAKIRSLKLIFNELSKEYGRDEIPYIFVETSLRNKSAHDAENNLIRSTLELSAAMIGGADAVFSNDYKINGSNSLSQEISFKQQIVLAYESIINVFDDAGNGSYYIGALTKEFAEGSWKYFIEIENKGGYSAVFKEGWLQQEIFDRAVREQKWVEEGKIKIIGVNLYPKLEKIKNTEDLYSNHKIKAVRLAEMFE